MAVNTMRRQRSIRSFAKSALNASQARARLNRYLLSEVGSQFCAGDPDLDVTREKWGIPILLVTPGFVAGQVGEASINLNTGEMEDHTDKERVYLSADKLRKRHHAAIKAAFLHAREG